MLLFNKFLNINTAFARQFYLDRSSKEQTDRQRNACFVLNSNKNKPSACQDAQKRCAVVHCCCDQLVVYKLAEGSRAVEVNGAGDKQHTALSLQTSFCSALEVLTKMRPPSQDVAHEDVENADPNMPAMMLCTRLAGRAIIRVVSRCNEAQENNNLGKRIWYDNRLLNRFRSKKGLFVLVGCRIIKNWNGK